MKHRSNCAMVLLLLLHGSLQVAPACGPFFPNWLIPQGDFALEQAPELQFRQELQRAFPDQPQFQARPGANPLQTLQAELDDLQTALLQAGATLEDAQAILRKHSAQRSKIAGFAVPAPWEEKSRGGPKPSWTRLRPETSRLPTNRLDRPRPVAGLPPEFADYFRGAVAWHDGQLKQARAAWQALLKRPPAERRYKSTWAAFMLGKSWEETDPGKAIQYFQLTRQLAAKGYTDSLGLAAASLGWEARLHYQDQDWARALDLYFQQSATGDPSSIISIKFAIASAFAEGKSTLSKLARNPRCRTLVTTYVLSQVWPNWFHTDGALKEHLLVFLEKASTKASFIPASVRNWHTHRSAAEMWLAAIEGAKVKDAALAEQMALAAYQVGEFDLTRRWIARARSTPVTQWLQAKLLLRDGKVTEAAALLANVVKHFPLERPATNQWAHASLEARLMVRSENAFGEATAGEYIRAELGLLALARRHYTEALDALLRAGYWADAAYVAEQVLTLEELKTYVDRAWPGPTPAPAAANLQLDYSEANLRDTRIGKAPTRGILIRYLLARRLARANRMAAARDYYPADCRPYFDAYRRALERAETKSAPREERAAAYWRAAKLCRHLGMELIGTELSPDWHLHGGSYNYGPELADRVGNTNAQITRASDDEVQRAARHLPDPNKRFHYRYLAADLAWQAATLMPNNSRQTALVLNTGGSWLKVRDPQAAARFYKALVWRCRKTDIGAEADRLRWFPALDEEGNLVRKE